SCPIQDARSFPVSCIMNPASYDFSSSFLSSSIDPIHFSSSPSSVFQIGSGVPQKRLRLRFQSTIFSSQFPKRPSPVDLGFQLIVLFNATIRSLTAVVFMNQASRG